MTTHMEDNVNTYSKPSELKITDLRIANLSGIPMRKIAIIRLETNQGLVGYGEVRDGGSENYALTLKRQVIGENPCNIDKVFRKVKQFGHHARQAGGVCGIEMALMDLAGKAYGVPAYQLAGGKFRDKVLCYSDTPTVNDGIEMGKRLKGRMDMGFKFLKMDVGISLLKGIPGTLVAPPGMLDTTEIMHQFTGIQITEKGIEILREYVEQVRSVVGYEIPLAVDHFGHIGLDSCIRLGQALEPYTLAWLEDMIPWQFPDQWRQLTDALTTPTCTGEDIYLKEGFIPLFEKQAIRVIHPDLASSGGILETKKIGDMAQEYGIAMAMHMAGSPITALANVHCAAATENFMVLENHSVDMPDWDGLVEGLPNPLIQDGYIQVPETPGLGFSDINEEMFRKYLDPKAPVFFDSSEAWDNDWSWDRLWS